MATRPNRCWHDTRSRAVPLGPAGDQWVFEKYVLYLLINRHCPNCFDDNEVSVALHQLFEQQDLPYEFCSLPAGR